MSDKARGKRAKEGERGRKRAKEGERGRKRAFEVEFRRAVSSGSLAASERPHSIEA
jgi:hypothetical protein